MTASSIAVRGTTLHVEDTGESSLPTILCLHSLFLDGRMFDDLVESARGRFRVVRPDFRGQGKSDLDTTTDEIDMNTCAADIEALIEHLQLKDISLAAQSMGGDVAFRVVAKRQDLFKSMVIMGSSARSEPADQLGVFRQWLEGVRKRGFSGETLDETMDVMFGKTTQADPTKAAMLELWRARIASLPKSLLPAMKGVVERRSSLPLLPGISIPVLIFSGEEDQPRPPAWCDEMAEALPNTKLVRLNRIGHSNILEAPEIVIPQLIEFFDANL